MRSNFLDFAFIQHNNLVRLLNGGQAVGNNNRCSSFHEVIDCMLDHFFRFGIY